jgi:hypothetical protein
MGGLVPPVVQMTQVSHPVGGRGMRRRQVEKKPEAVEVPLDIIVIGISFLKREARGELCLCRRLHPGWDGRDPDLRTFDVQFATKPLEMCAEV